MFKPGHCMEQRRKWLARRQQQDGAKEAGATDDVIAGTPVKEIKQQLEFVVEYGRS